MTEQDTEALESGKRAGFVVVLVVAFLAMASAGVPSPLYPLFQDRFGLSIAQTGFIYAVYALGVSLPLLLFGGLASRIGRKTTLVLGLLFIIVSSVLFIYFHSFAGFILARFVQGFGIGFVADATGLALGELAPKGRPHIAAHGSAAATTFGIAFGALSSGWMSRMAHDSVVAPFLMVFLGLVSVTTFVVFFLIDLHPHGSFDRSTQTLRGQLVARRSLRIPEGLGPTFFRSSVGLFSAWSAAGLVICLSSTMVRKAIGHNSVILGGSAVAVMMVAAGLTQLVMVASRRSNPPASDRNVTQIVGLWILAASLAIAAGGVMNQNIVIFFVAIALCGVGFALVYMSSTAIVQDSSRSQDLGGVMAAFFFIGYAGMAIPTAVFAFCAGIFGFVLMIKIFSVFLALLALIVTVYSSKVLTF